MRIFTTVELEYDGILWDGTNLEDVQSFLREYNMDDIAQQTFASRGYLHIHTHPFPYREGTWIMHGTYTPICADNLFTCSTDHFRKNFTVEY
jgi:hypothetical protein